MSNSTHSTPATHEAWYDLFLRSYRGKPSVARTAQRIWGEDITQTPQEVLWSLRSVFRAAGLPLDRCTLANVKRAMNGGLHTRRAGWELPAHR